MRRRQLLAMAASLAAAASLSGCYVIPIDPRYPDPTTSAAIAAATGNAPAPLPRSFPQTIHARLYPINDAAGQMGALAATVTDNLNGHAVFAVNIAGEMLQGEASRVANTNPGFGHIHQQVYGTGRMPAGQRGIASAAGTKGLYVNCEYALSAPARGTGACLFSNGAKYQLHFGG